MNAQVSEYCWLTGAWHADDFFGSVTGLPLPHLLRHGISESSEGKDNTLADVVETVRKGWRNFYLAGDVGKDEQLFGGRFYLPSWSSSSIVVDELVLKRLKSTCDLSGCYIEKIDPKNIHMHGWRYTLPRDPEDLSLYQQLQGALGYDAMPDDTDVLRLLCERYPHRGPTPVLYVVLPPYFHRGSEVQKSWERDNIVLKVGANVSVVTRLGDVRPDPNYFASRPLVRYEGFLFPSGVVDVAHATARSKQPWPILEAVRSVTIRFHQ